MKDFLKYTLATIVGILLAGILFFFIGVGTLFGIVASGEAETRVPQNSFMFLDLSGNLEERSEESVLDFFTSSTFNKYGLDDILSSIKKAKETENIKGIYIQAEYLNSSFASLEEIRNALIDFKESGKFIVSYSDNYTQGLYYLASVSDKVILNPAGAIEWKGLASQPIFYKDLLKKVGVEMQIFKVGTYKSAVEPFISTEMSPENRKQVQEFLSSIWNRILSDVSSSRNISQDSLNYYANQLLMFYPAEESIKAGLVDTLLYKDGVRNYLKDLCGIGYDDNLQPLDLNNMIYVKKNIPKDKSGNIVAVYYAYGDIDGLSEEGIDSKKVVRDLRKLREDKDVKAVVLRVNSPGGSAYGSEQIWHEVTLLKKEKPVIVSMGDYAASGGYYISAAADYILAQPTTLTGSIGIFGMVPNLQGLTDKIGLDFDVVKTNKFADMGNLMRPLNNDEKNLIQMYINQGYNLFIKRCADGRNMSTQEIEKIAEGRVWTGETAKNIGLIDELGGIDKAIEIAAQRADITNYTLITYPKKRDFLSLLMEQKSTGFIQAELKKHLGEIYEMTGLIKNLEKVDYLQARMPFYMNIQ